MRSLMEWFRRPKKIDAMEAASKASKEQTQEILTLIRKDNPKLAAGLERLLVTGTHEKVKQ